MHSNLPVYDFKRCKLCGSDTAKPAFALARSTVYACSDCDFHYLDYLDQAERENQRKKLSDNDRRYIELREKESAELHPARMKLVLQAATIQTGRLLDIGAGIGQFQLLASQHGFNCRGIEPSSLRRQYARESSGLELTEHLVESDYWQIHFCRAFDVITLWDVIEHVNFPRETLEYAVKLLRPGGALLLDTPSRSVLPYKISTVASRLSGGLVSLFLPHYYSDAPYGHKQIFTPDQLTGLLRELGLSVTVEQRSYAAPNKGNKIILAATKTA